MAYEEYIYHSNKQLNESIKKLTKEMKRQNEVMSFLTWGLVAFGAAMMIVTLLGL